MIVNYEVPNGIIDGTNKIFTLLNIPDLDQMLNVYRDGTIDVAFTINGSILTLVDAPINNLYVSYYTGKNTTSTTSQDTFGEIIQEVWDLLGQSSNSTIFSRSKVSKKVNAKIKEVLRGRITSILDQRIYRAGSLNILEEKASYTANSGSRLSQGLNINDTILYCDTTDLLPSGYCQIGYDIIKYTSKTTTTLEGITGVLTNHLESEKITQLYQMPLNCEKVKDLNGIPYDNLELKTICYNVHFFNGVTLLKIIGYTGLFGINYMQKVFDLVDDDDLCILGDNYGTEVIAPLVAGEFAIHKGIPTHQSILLSGYANLQNMYQYYNKKIYEVQQTVKPISYGFNSIKKYV